MSRIFLIDTDTASDDAVALIMALRSPAVEVAAISVVSGNLGVDQACLNALYTTELCGSDVPVFKGAAAPLARPLEDASWFHGMDGLGDHGYPSPRRSVEKQHAVEAIVETINAHPGLELVTLGPLTNIALALQRKPEIVKKVSRCILMGGAPCCEGNVTPAAEFNIWCDPEAAHIVIRSGLPIELIGWQLCRGKAAMDEHDIERALGMGTELARFAVECNSTARAAYLEQTGEVGISLPDPVAMSIALDRSVGTSWSKRYVDVETASPLTRGMTVVDRLNVSGNMRNKAVWHDLLRNAPNADVCWEIDIPKWKKLLFEKLL